MGILSPTESTSKLFRLVLKGEVTSIMESMSAHLGDSSAFTLLHLSNWTVRLLLDIQNPLIEGHDLLESAQRIMNLLTTYNTFSSPMTHYSFALAVLTLVELYNNTTHHEAAKAILQLPGAISHAPTAWDKVIEQRIHETLNVPTTESLQQLAEAAGKAATAASDAAVAASSAFASSAAANGASGVVSSDGGAAGSNMPAGEFSKLVELVRKGYLLAF